MKMKVKMLSILLVACLCFTSTTLVYAAGIGATEDESTSQGTQAGQQDLTEQDGTSNNTSDNDESGNGDILRDRTRLMDESCISLSEELSELESSSNELKNQYQTALKLQNESEAQLLRERLQIKEQEKSDCTEQLKQVRAQLRETVRTSYTEEEMARIRTVEMELKQKYPNDSVLPVENIIPLGFTIKFDTPPVVRDGRTLVPLRALAEGMGAAVTWNGEESKIILQKEGIKIELQLRNRIAYVNGEEINLDVPPETINNRTTVPLRFLLQQFGYDVNWDNESGIIEIISPDL